MAQREPDRFGKAIGSLQRVMQLQAAQQQQQQQKALQERQQFQEYTKTENARFAELVKDVQPAEMRAIEAEVPRMLKDYGASAAQFLEAISTQTAFPRAAAERIMVDAAKYRLMQQAAKPVATRNLPPVQRPGTSNAVRSDSATAKIKSLEKQLSSASGDKAARISAEIWGLQKRARG